jgi:hypothetical protein
MKTVTITARINESKKAEFFQTMESLKPLIKNYCSGFDVTISKDNELTILITFSSKDELETNFYNTEFNILKGSVISLCDDVKIKVSDSLVTNS